MRFRQAVQETPISFLQGLYQETNIEAKTLRWSEFQFQFTHKKSFFSTRLNSLLRHLELGDLDQFTPISIVADFATLIGTYAKGFLIVLDYDDRYNEPFLQFW